MTLKIHCLKCDTLLALAEQASPSPALTHRTRWEQVTPPDAPEERWKWWCPRPDCRRTRELRSARIAATLDDMARRHDHGGHLTR
jgi:hypothetical protein